jgi:nitrate/TMAO reductase-like tetraheme cytochrome c subunit
VSATVPGEDNAAFLARHWQRPLTAQGAAPRHFSVQEAALDPAACGACHAQQYEDWRTTWHARAMGPGVLGQLLDMAPEARDEHQDCIRCHAPLAEQADGLVAAIAGKLKTGLHAEGLVCAACHVREHRRYGPPRRDGSVAKPEEKLPHDGWQASAAFADSRFCAACHQFEADGFALNGKLLENTYAEWQASPAAREGRTCQSCHMPDRRHLWRGVHDADMVKSGVVIAQEAPRFESGAVLARLTLTNSGTGHHFPTYVTPRVVAEIEQADAEGRALPGTRQEHVIARQVSPDLSREIADTRLAAGAAARLDYRAPRHPRAARLDYRVRVEPDAFYTGLYRSLLADGGAGQGRALIRQALDDSLASHFTIYEKSRSLQDGAGKP